MFSELTHYHMHVVLRYENQSFADFLSCRKGNDVNKDLASVRKMLEEVIGSIRAGEVLTDLT